MKHDLVVQCAPKQRMWMADDGRMRRVAGPGVEESFKASGGAIEKERTD